MIRHILPVLVYATAAWADSAWPNGLTVTFNGGTALEIHTESTRANSPLSTSGSVAISDRNEVSRTVVDKQGRMLFTYDIEATPEGGSAARYTIRIKPHDPNRVNLSYFTFAAGDQVGVGDAVYTVRADGKIAVDRVGDIVAAGLSPDRLATALRERLKDRVNVTVKSARRDVPTVAAVREFKGVKVGEGVSIDILFNPATGERIFDVIQPLAPGSRGVQTARDAPRMEDEFSLMKTRIAINGKTVDESTSWMIGGALKIAMPGHGTVYLAIHPVTSHAFQATGRAEKGKLSFPIGADFVEITSAENIMKKSEYRTIWVYWDANAPNTETVDITCSGTIESLLPKKESR